MQQTALRENFPEKRRFTNKLMQLQNNKRFWNIVLSTQIKKNPHTTIVVSDKIKINGDFGANVGKTF